MDSIIVNDSVNPTGAILVSGDSIFLYRFLPLHVVNSCGLIGPVDVILQLMIEKHFEQNGSR